MKRHAFANWKGNLKEGKGTISTESNSVSELDYSFGKRFGQERGTNPEELIAAAHAGCFAMAFSAELEKRKLMADSIDVKASVSLEKSGDAWSIPTVHLEVAVNVPATETGLVEEAAQTAKTNCPISKLLKANITMSLQFSQEEAAVMQ